MQTVPSRSMRNSHFLQSEIRESRMIIGSSSQRPMELAVGLFYGLIVDAGITVMHDAVSLPIFIAIGTKPIAGIVVRFIGETHCNARSVERPQLLDQALIQFALPLSRKESHNSALPFTNSARFRQRLSTVYAKATFSGSREFHPSSALRTF